MNSGELNHHFNVPGIVESIASSVGCAIFFSINVGDSYFQLLRESQGSNPSASSFSWNASRFILEGLKKKKNRIEFYPLATQFKTVSCLNSKDKTHDFRLERITNTQIS